MISNIYHNHTTSCRRRKADSRQPSTIRRPNLIIFIAIINSYLCSAQPLVQQITPFTVTTKAGPALRNPFSGGLKQTRIGVRDVNGDGRPDLFTLNPDNHLRLYRNEGTFRFSRVFPSPYDALPIRSWFRFADLDGDGNDDLLTSSPTAVVLLYHNTGTTAQPVFTTPDTLRGDDGQLITAQQETVPSFVDINADGDLDLFIGNLSGTITYYENIGTKTAPKFHYRTDQYMNIIVISSGTRRKDGSGISATEHHGASVLDFADMDGDGDPDMFFGDFFTTKLLYFHNDGTAQNAAFSMSRLDTAFRPAGETVTSDGFNQAVAADVDGDGDLDVLVSSLLPGFATFPITLYENKGTTTSPKLQSVPINITDELDVVEYAAPVRIRDNTRDGVLIGSADGTLTYYRFTYPNGGRDIAWNEEGKYFTNNPAGQIAPAVGDLIGNDGAAEIVTGDAEGYLKLYRFSGNTLTNITWQLDTFRTGSYSSPALVDMDNDGDLDLMLGNGGGRFVYFENTGTKASPIFERRTPPKPFDTLDVGGNAAPRFADINNDGFPDALVGGNHLVQFNETQGFDTVRIYLNAKNGTFLPSSSYPDIAAALYPVPMLLNTPHANYLIVGTFAGGLVVFIDSASVSGVADRGNASAVELSPTVLRGSERSLRIIHLSSTNQRPTIIITDLPGNTILYQQLTTNTTILLPDDMPSGMYFVLIEDGAVRFRKKIIKMR